MSVEMKIERKSDWLNVIRRLEKEATEWVGRGGRWAVCTAGLRGRGRHCVLRRLPPWPLLILTNTASGTLRPQLLPQRRRKQSQKQFKLWSDNLRQAIKPLDSPIVCTWWQWVRLVQERERGSGLF